MSQSYTLIQAVLDKKHAHVKALLEAGANPNEKDGHGYSPIFRSLFLGDEKMMRLLIDHGAHIHETGDDNELLLPIAAGDGKLKIVRLLLEKGADVNQCNMYQESALWYTAATHYWNPDCLEIARVLLEAGADINHVNTHGVTPLWLSAMRGYEELALLLLSKGADPHQSNADEQSPLYMATRYGHVGMVSLLLAQGADMNKKDSKGQSPYYLSQMQREMDADFAAIADVFNAIKNKAALEESTPQTPTARSALRL